MGELNMGFIGAIVLILVPVVFFLHEVLELEVDFAHVLDFFGLRAHHVKVSG